MAAFGGKTLKGRYQLLAPIGRGGMGEVWRAQDSELGSDCAVKIMRDSADSAVLDLFNREQSVLAELRSPHVVPIYDRGTLEDAGGVRPFFVMPLLRGATLAALIKESSSRITVEWLVDVIRQVCRGLQAAHDRQIFHRDLKPSNIFVDENDSATVIDFGVAHLGDTQNSGFRGTPQYTAPELVDPQTYQEPSSASDVFSLAVVMFEALTGQRPFERKNERETLHAILAGHPPPLWKVNPQVSVALGKVVHRAMAKQPLHRYSTAREFAEKLLKAQRGEALPETDLARILPRIERARRALAEGDYQTAHGMVSELQLEGEADPILDELREQIDQAIHQRAIYQQLESARALVAQEDPMAVAKLQEILQVDPANTEARRLLNDYRDKKSDRDVEKWLNLAQRHLEVHDFRLARESIQEVLSIRPDTRAFAMMAELDRQEKEFETLCAEKEKLFQEAQRAYDNREFSTALSKMGRLLALGRPAGDSALLEREVAYQDFYNRVHSEYDEINRAHAEGQKCLVDGNFTRTFEICARFPGNPLFDALKLETEERQRHQRSSYLAEASLRAENESDLDKRVAILEEAATRYPADTQFQERLGIARERRNLIASMVDQARAYESQGSFNEALGRWEAIRKVHPKFPGLAFEIDRLSRQRDRATQAESLTRWRSQIDECLGHQDYERALALCSSAFGEFPDEASLKERERLALQGAGLATEAKKQLEQAEALVAQGSLEEALRILRSAQDLPVRSPMAKVLFVDTLARSAWAVLDADPRQAEALADEALRLDPNYGPARSIRAELDNRARTQLITRVQQLQSEGDLRGAAETVRCGLLTYTADTELTRLLDHIGKAIAVSERPRALQELQRLSALAQAARDADTLAGIVENARRVAADFPADEEIRNLLAGIEQRRIPRPSAPALKRIRGWFVRPPAKPGEVKQPPVRGRRLGSKPLLAGAALLALILLGAGVWAALQLRPPPPEPAVGTAVVKAPSTYLFRNPDVNGRRLLTLSRGTKVNLLEGVTSPAQPLVRVQFVSPQRNSRPGYVKTADLDRWSSSHPRVAWQLMAFVLPPAAAGEEDRRRFAEELRRFGERFPATPEADNAYVKAAGIYISLAEPCKIPDQAPPRCLDDLKSAQEALARVSTASTATTALRGDLDAILAAQSKYRENKAAEILQGLLVRIYKERHEGNYEGVCSVANEMANIDPKRAQSWKDLAKVEFHRLHPNQQLPGCE